MCEIIIIVKWDAKLSIKDSTTSMIRKFRYRMKRFNYRVRYCGDIVRLLLYKGFKRRVKK